MNESVVRLLSPRERPLPLFRFSSTPPVWALHFAALVTVVGMVDRGRAERQLEVSQSTPMEGRAGLRVKSRQGRQSKAASSSKSGQSGGCGAEHPRARTVAAEDDAAREASECDLKGEDGGSRRDARTGDVDQSQASRDEVEAVGSVSTSKEAASR
ncbi:uncharacterized protein PSFLO_02179 [Pseudozyma flocculosa]|uniref:Uncharacterized protein n=1 Tax=Pseudozyma flocculosa TaxID=84751 RepID=A0A5C3EWV9_9BASI|nr:uncharacterized protein PSFLO_02179 [Pseudozyma flocculosa]